MRYHADSACNDPKAKRDRTGHWSREVGLQANSIGTGLKAHSAMLVFPEDRRRGVVRRVHNDHPRARVDGRRHFVPVHAEVRLRELDGDRLHAMGLLHGFHSRRRRHAIAGDPLAKERDFLLLGHAVGVYEVVARAGFHGQIERHREAIGGNIFGHEGPVADRNAEALHGGARREIE